MQQNSEVARRMHLIQLEREAAERGLCGFAEGTARHAFLEARAARGADVIFQLMQEGRCAEAIALMETPDWGERASSDVGGDGEWQKESSSSLNNSTSK
jgi:hypothetical protein